MKKGKTRITITIWGSRGSIPAPGQKNAHFGGNTSCTELRFGKELIIFDAGTGLRELGIKLASEGKLSASILFSHYHWDHIMGLPFFVPGYNPKNHFRIYGESKHGISLRSILGGQMAFPYFPVSLEEMLSRMEFIEIGPGQDFTIGRVKVHTFRSNHPDGCLAYRLIHSGRVITYATDTEHFTEPDRNLIRAAKNADILFYDSQYTESEYPEKVGWGHSTWIEGVKLAKAADCRRLILFHHDPSHDDEQIQEIERLARKEFRNTRAAFEGMKITL